MDNYISRLIISYLFHTENDYEISELMQLTGMGSKQLTEIMNDLFDKNYVEYCEYELQITPKGKAFLISNDSLCDSFSDDYIILRNINPQSALKTDEFYVPKGFTHKYKNIT